MGRLDQYGLALAPSGAITTLLKGWMNAWSYDHKNPANAVRDKSVLLHNAVEEAMGKYQEQLKVELSRLRKMLPQPTRENPYPPMEGIEAVQELEAYMRKVEHVRTLVRSAYVPPRDIVWHGSAEDAGLMSDLLRRVDLELFQSVIDMNVATVDAIERLLSQRNGILQRFKLS